MSDSEGGIISGMTLISRKLRSGAVVCPLCGGRNWKPSGTVRGVWLWRCVKCGLLGTSSFLEGNRNAETLYDLTAEDYSTYRDQYLRSRLAVYGREVGRLERFRTTGRLLEIGCGYGYFLETASRLGWNSEGVEISGYACEVARSRGCRVHHCELQDAGLSLGSFDVIVMWDVIEHFPAPREIVRRCASLLRSGGALVVRTPDARALAPSLGLIRAAYRHLVYPANTAEHVFHFTPGNLFEIMREVGFGRIEVNLDNGWRERVISGNNGWVRAFRWVIMRYAYARGWPYEFVLTAIKG